MMTLWVMTAESGFRFVQGMDQDRGMGLNPGLCLDKKRRDTLVTCMYELHAFQR